MPEPPEPPVVAEPPEPVPEPVEEEVVPPLPLLEELIPEAPVPPSGPASLTSFASLHATSSVPPASAAAQRPVRLRGSRGQL
jgi:hypothetical protein